MKPFWMLLLALAACPSPQDPDDDDSADDDDDSADDDDSQDDDDATADDDDSTPDWRDDAFCDTDGVTVTPEGAGFRVTTDEYDLYAEVELEEAEVMGAMLAAAYDAFSAWFGATAPPSLEVELWATEAAWANSIAADGLDVPWGAGGLYHSASQTAYLWRQPTRYYTRQLLLHEVGHQFHYLARTGNQGIPGWYAEGVAEFISRHDWDGACLQLGVRPLVSQADLPEAAQSFVNQQGFPLGDLLDDTGVGGRPLQHQLFRYFEAQHPADWQAFKDLMDAHPQDPRAEFEAIFGPADALEATLEEHVAADQEPLDLVYSDWSHIHPHAVEGWSQYLTIARMKQDPSWFTASFAPVSSPFGAGVLLAWESNDNYLALIVADNGNLWTFDMVDGSATWWDQGIGPGGPVYTFDVTWDDPEVTVQINDQTWTDTLSNPPAAGVVVNGATMLFEHIAWTD